MAKETNGNNKVSAVVQGSPEYAARLKSTYAVLKTVAKGDQISVRTTVCRGNANLDTKVLRVKSIKPLARSPKGDLDITLVRTDKDVGDIRITVLKDALLPVIRVGTSSVAELQDVSRIEATAKKAAATKAKPAKKAIKSKAPKQGAATRAVEKARKASRDAMRTKRTAGVLLG